MHETAQYMPIPLTQDEYDTAIKIRLENEIRAMDSTMEQITRLNITSNGIENLDVHTKYIYERLNQIQYLNNVLKSYKS